MLIIGILISTDKRNGPASPCLVPLALFFTILGIGLGLGLETGWAVNPARDLGPRILTAMVGYGKAGMHFVLHIGSVAHSSSVFDYRSQYWIWCPILGPILGMQAGALAYDALVYTGSDSFLNKPYVLKNSAFPYFRQQMSFFFLRDTEAVRRHIDGCAQYRNGAGRAAVEVV